MADDGDLRIEVDGISADVEILIDANGVPHLRAEGRDDLFFAQGFNAARDRLFQIDLWRRRGLGLLAEVFGEQFVAQDRAARLFRYRGDSRTEWLAYGSSTKAIATAFTAGVNAGVDWALAAPGRLPPEFLAHDYRPAHWAPEDLSLIRSHGLFYNAEQELSRALTLRDSGSEAESLRQEREPADPIVIPDGLDLSVLSADMLDTYRLGLSPVSPAGIVQRVDVREASGSNNWVVAGARTATGRPLLANDPHRAVTLPSLRYLAHLTAPGIDVIGGGEPALPGISIGHNGQVAFGLTIWPADQEDLYVYELHPDDPLSYRYGDGWERMRVVRESVVVAGAEPMEVELRFTRHGPVIFEAHERRVAVALRAVWLEPGMAPYLASLEYLRAADADEFVDALNRWAAPAVNHVYATPDGTIGLKNAALIPRRPNWDGSLPVPGDGRYEWDGFVHADELPSQRDPACGWIATANEMNLPDGYDNTDRTVTYDWYPDGRRRRIAAVLEDEHEMTVDRSVALQNDVRSTAGLDLLNLVRTLVGTEPARGSVAAETLTELLSWDGEEHTHSREALLFQVWVRRHLRPALLTERLRAVGNTQAQVDAAMPALLRDESFSPDLRGLLRALRSTLDSGAADRTTVVAIIHSTLAATIDELTALFGDDRADWRWGRLHRAELVNGFLEGQDVPTEWQRLGPAPKRGSGESVGLGASDASFRLTMGSTFRVVVDVGDWDRTVGMNAPGQSGDPRSPHYADLFQPWLDAEAFPLPYSAEAVAAAAVRRIVLVPRR